MPYRYPPKQISPELCLRDTFLPKYYMSSNSNFKFISDAVPYTTQLPKPMLGVEPCASQRLQQEQETLWMPGPPKWLLRATKETENRLEVGGLLSWSLFPSLLLEPVLLLAAVVVVKLCTYAPFLFPVKFNFFQCRYFRPYLSMTLIGQCQSPGDGGDGVTV